MRNEERVGPLLGLRVGPLLGFIGAASPKRRKVQPELNLSSLVEMGRIELPSKHRTRELSTRLVCLWFSTQGCR